MNGVHTNTGRVKEKWLLRLGQKVLHPFLKPPAAAMKKRMGRKREENELKKTAGGRAYDDEGLAKENWIRNGMRSGGQWAEKGDRLSGMRRRIV